MADRRIITEAAPEEADRLVSVLQEAVARKASDIHFEPGISKYRIRIRVDGRMQTMDTGEMSDHQTLMNRLKILCGMDITERRKPQDGGFSHASQDHIVDFRVSMVPVADGEKAAIRILDDQSLDLDRRSLGISNGRWELLENFIQARHGLIILTGPTGSGKTTTLYTLLKLLNTEHRHIITLEDPIEYRLAGVNQIQVNERIDLSFAKGLRAILRQDPEVIMVGEIRDTQTAEIAVRAAITGHLVLSTLHTNDSHGAVTRLMDMGIEPYLIAASLSGICSQRLVRRLCDCKTERDLNASETILFDEILGTRPEKLCDAAGCAICHGGFSGRTAITEVLPVCESLRQGILLREDADRLKKRTPGFESLMVDGMRKAAAGDTTLEEVMDAVRR